MESLTTKEVSRDIMTFYPEKIRLSEMSVASSNLLLWDDLCTPKIHMQNPWLQFKEGGLWRSNQLKGGHYSGP
jgi:hypothetical protein